MGLLDVCYRKMLLCILHQLSLPDPFRSELYWSRRRTTQRKFPRRKDLWLLSVLVLAVIIMFRLPKRYQEKGPFKITKRKMREMKRARSRKCTLTMEVLALLWTSFNKYIWFSTFDCHITFAHLTSLTHFISVYCPGLETALQWVPWKGLW